MKRRTCRRGWNLRVWPMDSYRRCRERCLARVPSVLRACQRRRNLLNRLSGRQKGSHEAGEFSSDHGCREFYDCKAPEAEVRISDPDRAQPSLLAAALAAQHCKQDQSRKADAADCQRSGEHIDRLRNVGGNAHGSEENAISRLAGRPFTVREICLGLP